MSRAWVAVALCGLATAAIKATGPVLLGGRPLPSRLPGLVGLLAPALLAALVATQAFGGERRLVLDARTLGLVAAAAAVWRRLPALAVVAIAAAVTALARALA